MSNKIKENHRSIYLDLLSLFIVFIAFLWIPFWMVRSYISRESLVASMYPNAEQHLTYKEGIKMSDLLTDTRRMIEEEKVYYIQTGGTEEGFYAAIEMILEEMEAESKKEDQE